ncbi:MAG: DUF1801 domain-containing protein [Gammaproteobacteria bacterium]|nr:DUF1801 domain-containing protein [Gammaproteobacteria bacterium]
MISFQSDEVEVKFQAYPEDIRPIMLQLRHLVFEVAQETEELEHLTETLKWGEPSYCCKSGSTLRMDWKEKNPTSYALYFNCNSKLVDTFKTLYGSIFSYEGNRAIVFRLDEEIPITEVKHCIKLTLTYHKVKHLSLLGV